VPHPPPKMNHPFSSVSTRLFSTGPLAAGCLLWTGVPFLAEAKNFFLASASRPALGAPPSLLSSEDRGFFVQG
jgi:hypothetical protein